MSRRDLVAYLHAHVHAQGCRLRREGGRHSVFVNPANGQTSAVPRQNQVNDFLARKVCRDMGIPTP